MYRKGLIGILKDHPASVRQLALQLGVPQKELEDDLRHLLKSLRNLPGKAEITPAQCRKCGFVFNKDKLHKPGKCPACHGTWISEPLIRVREP